MDINKLLLEIYSTKPLTLLQKEYNLDPRTIKSYWIKVFGEKVVKNRVINSNNSVYNKNIYDIYDAVNNGLCLTELSKKFNIKKRTIQKYVSLDKNIYKKYLHNNSIYRSNRMKDRPNSISKETKKQILSYFNTNLFVKEIAEKFSLCSSSIIKIFKEFSCEKYNERVKRIEIRRSIKSMKAMEEAGRLGSKREIAFYNQLNKRLNAEIIHHDYDLIPPYEIDITIPELKIAICWDGIGHFKPIFGKDVFNKVFYRDKYKRRKIKKLNWFAFVIKDLESHFNENKYRKIHNRFDSFLIKIGYGDYIDSSF